MRISDWSSDVCSSDLLRIVERDDLAALGHNSPAYIHLLTEALKLACADRERWYGDPRFVDVPLERLLSSEYGALRRGLIDPGRVAADVPNPGDPRAMLAKTEIGRASCRERVCQYV